jgi:hypothetical protein
MDDNQRLQLQNMIKTNNVEDQTELIRSLKHSQVLRDELNALLMIKKKHQNTNELPAKQEENIYVDAINECGFLFTYYTDIFNKVRKDEIEISILYRFLDVLKQIENEELDQHEGSFQVGSILKELYVDSALKKAEKLDKIADKTQEYRGPDLAISWREYKAYSNK